METIDEINQETIVEESRKLATIRKIKSVEDIIFENDKGEQEVAQNIVKATVDGWHLVTQRSNGFKPDDLVVYFEIDSVLPSDNPEFAFLEKYKYRLKTIKLKGQISQGLILPLSILETEDNKIFTNKEAIPEGVGDPWAPVVNIQEGEDVTQYLGVKKYEPVIPANLAGKVRGNFPFFLRKTDEERIQNCGWLLGKYGDLDWIATEKLDGSSFTCYRKDGVFGVCSRNQDLEETSDNAFWQLARRLKIEENLINLGHDNICIQGEMVGPGIQGNKYNLKETKLYVFNLFDIETQEYCSCFNKEEKLRQFHWDIVGSMGLEWAPDVLDFGEGEAKLPLTVDEILALADGPSMVNPKANREGLVFRPIKEITDPKFGRVSFKAISNKWLLKNDG